MIPCALTIAGSDPTGGAGIQADLKTFAAQGIYGLSVIAALTAQNSEGVHDVLPVTPAFFSSQIDALLADFRISAVKIGMLYSREIIESLVKEIKARRLPNLVLDPLIGASAGGMLIDVRGIEIIKRDLLPLVTIVTPNLHEAGVLAGIEAKDLDGMREAASVIKSMGPQHVLVKGGHLEGAITDILFDGREFMAIPHLRILKEVHGTGCTLSAAITALLAKGNETRQAVLDAERYVQGVIAHAFSFKRGPWYPNHFPDP